jgi:hypothetical protein
MKFEIEVCTKIAYKKGKLVLSRNLLLDSCRGSAGVGTQKNVQVPWDGGKWGIQYQQMKERLKKD